jgi:hypothetical protein
VAVDFLTTPPLWTVPFLALPCPPTLTGAIVSVNFSLSGSFSLSFFDKRDLDLMGVGDTELGADTSASASFSSSAGSSSFSSCSWSSSPKSLGGWDVLGVPTSWGSIPMTSGGKVIESGCIIPMPTKSMPIPMPIPRSRPMPMSMGIRSELSAKELARKS